MKKSLSQASAEAANIWAIDFHSPLASLPKPHAAKPVPFLCGTKRLRPRSGSRVKSETVTMQTDACGYEPTDVSPSLLCLLAAGMLALLAGGPLGLMVFYPSALHRAAVTSFAAEQGPRLQTDPGEELSILRQNEVLRLTGYGWVDPKRNIVRIPIARAMSLIEQRGLPGWSKP
jgi:hypothetical protein